MQTLTGDVFDQHGGMTKQWEEKAKKDWGRNIRDSPFTSYLSKAFALTQLCSTETMTEITNKLLQKDMQHSEFDEKTLLCALNAKEGVTSFSLLACAASCPTEFP